MASDLRFALVTFDNVKKAVEVQKTIFPHEDGTLNLLASLDRKLFIDITGIEYLDDNAKYYLAFWGNEPVGITGLYCYLNEYPRDAWIAWYGVKSQYRKKGFGREILHWTICKAREEGYKNIRLYTDSKENIEAIKLYEKLGFVGEKYRRETLAYDCYIYSKSLSGVEVEPWNDKMLYLANQSELDQLNHKKIKEILRKYDSYIKG